MTRFKSPEAALGLDEIISAIEARAASAGGKELVGKLAPAVSRAEAERALDETGAMTALMEKRPDFGFEPFENVLPLLERARKAHALTGEELRLFVPLLKTAEKISAVFEAEVVAEGHPLWTDIPSVHGLGEVIDEAIDEDGAVKPDATPQIEKLSRAARSLHRLIREKAEAMLKNFQDMLQDEYVTLRENRFVLPIKAEHKSHVEGIVHDSSNSGQTFFIEPKALVDLNNRLRTQEMRLADEIEKLLLDLSRMVGEEAGPVEDIYHAVTRLDLISSRARLAKDIGGSRPVFGLRLDLKNAVSPVMALEGKEAVANDMAIPEGARGLMISGPNTGGKTVALKTIGLMALMARMGLFIPAAEGSAVPFYAGVYADIGDSQSIADDLSTFSAHLVMINEILEKAGPGSLALLDELMVSTDPREGSALAIAVLDRLVERGADVVVTTHFSELKLLAQSQPLYHNVSMEFDKAAAMPTYRMISGAPGESSALAVAERLGMDAEIVAAARTRLEGGDERIEMILEDLARQRTEMERARRQAEAALEEARGLREEAQRIRDEAAEKKGELARTARRKLSSDIAAARERISKLVEEVKSAEDRKKTARRARERLDRLNAEAKEAAAPEERISGTELREGDEVYVVPLERRGRLAADPADGRAEVAFGTMRVTLELDNLVGLERAEEKPPQTAARIAAVALSESERPSGRIDIRGARAEEAVERVEKFLDEAMRAGMERARIIHGKGAGALRAAVREYLSGSPYVAEFYPADQREGGDGVTVVILGG
ncbi:MAG: endonuclease MutS2 [Candidatus Nitrospinota bacterium M3_3B_026]